MIQPILADLLPYGLTDSQLQDFAEILAPSCFQVYGVLKMFTMAIAFLGLLMAAYKVQMGGDLTTLGMQLVMTLLVAVSVSDYNFPRWFLDADIALASGFNSLIGFQVMETLLDFLAWIGFATLEALPVLITIMIAAGFWGIGTGFIALAAVSCLLIALSWILLGICYGVVLVAYLAQIAVLYIGIAMAPLFLGMLLYEKTRETGFKYIMGLVGIIFWPLGWNLGFLVLHSITKFPDGPLWTLFYATAFGAAFTAINIVLAGVLGLGVALLLFGVIWAVITKAPGVISAAITTGAQVGTGLMSAAAGGAASSLGMGVSAAGSVAMVAATGGGGAAAGIGGGGGGAAMGSKPPMPT